MTQLTKPPADAWIPHPRAPLGCLYELVRASQRSVGAAQCGSLQISYFGGFALCSAYRALGSSREVAKPARQRPLVRYPRIKPHLVASKQCRRTVKPKPRRYHPFWMLQFLLFYSRRSVISINHSIIDPRFRIYISHDRHDAWEPLVDLPDYRFIAPRRAFNIVVAGVGRGVNSLIH